ncbi:hypothetical protein K501DRAFT_325447 [Backusella circina FSU 941]|nr:hypothetical protein K501DRAFT_325447 [Backusella circina FSU 941]
MDYIPPPFQFPRPSQSDKKYRLTVVQDPIRARCCGFGEKDRRPIDPPPIVELIAEDRSGKRIELNPADTVLFVVQCELYSEDKEVNKTLVYAPWSVSSRDEDPNKKPEFVRSLMGSTVSNVYHLYNEDNVPGTYFIFHDLSVRTEGVFRLKFVFVNLAEGEPLTMSTRVQLEIFSNPFSVYTAKKVKYYILFCIFYYFFTNKSIVSRINRILISDWLHIESTSLSRCFSKQGIKIPIRNESHKNDSYVPRLLEREDDIPPERSNCYTRLLISDLILPE